MDLSDNINGADPVPLIINILLADDDIDDCDLFRTALLELNVGAEFTVVYDGAELMKLLKEYNTLPCVLFLDQNMPKKNGMACLQEIKEDEKLRTLPVYILSTSFDKDIIQQLYAKGAQHYVRKPNGFSDLKQLILHALTITELHKKINQKNKSPEPEENFVLENRSLL